ncbi:MAG: hypothetical protein CM1200mP41_03500 [Gammaproteobacteria bacterium]|nr:MAG: hypothetical protein CM1200mP41_03500 [Gammaproteobacteria bacterium]
MGSPPPAGLESTSQWLRRAGAVCYVIGLSFWRCRSPQPSHGLPILLTLLAMIVLPERVNAGRWFAVVVGFAGIVLVVQPWDAHWNGLWFAAISAYSGHPAILSRVTLTRSCIRYRSCW